MVFDAHADLLYDVARRRLLQGETRVLERHHADRLRAGGVEGLVLAVWVSAAQGKTFWQDTCCFAPEDDLERTRAMLACARADLAESVSIRLVHTWQEACEARRAGVIYAFLGIEGMAAIGPDLRGIDLYYHAGARTGMLTWNEENALATGAKGDPQKGLTDLGCRAVRRMQALGMLVDVSHLNDGGFWDVMRLTTEPIAATHSNSRALCDVPRNLTDEQLRAIRDTGGVVGLNAFHSFVHAEAQQQTARTLALHAAHMVDVMGIDHVGCGFDFCHFMGPGNESARGLEDARGIPGFFDELERLGMSAREREKIAVENFARVFGTLGK